MPFRDDPTKRPLYDTLDGGPPRAWECKFAVERNNKELLEVMGRCLTKPCGKICLTLDGLRRHQKMVHNFEEQTELKDAEENAGRKPDAVRDAGEQPAVSLDDTRSESD